MIFFISVLVQFAFSHRVEANLVLTDFSQEISNAISEIALKNQVSPQSFLAWLNPILDLSEKIPLTPQQKNQFLCLLQRIVEASKPQQKIGKLITFHRFNEAVTEVFSLTLEIWKIFYGNEPHYLKTTVLHGDNLINLVNELLGDNFFNSPQEKLFLAYLKGDFKNLNQPLAPEFVVPTLQKLFFLINRKIAYELMRQNCANATKMTPTVFFGAIQKLHHLF